MKKLIFVLMILLLSAGQAFARLGETEQLLSQRYGAPVKVIDAAGFDKAFLYNSRIYVVKAYLKGGTAAKLIFSLKGGGRLSMNRLEHLLHKNGSGTNAMYGRSVWYIETVSNNGNIIKFVDRASGKKTAFYNLDKRSLTIELI